MPKFSTVMSAIALALAIGLTGLSDDALAGHKSDGYAKNGGQHSAQHKKQRKKQSARRSHEHQAGRDVRRDRDRGDRKGGHGGRRIAKDGHGHGYGHKQARKHGYGRRDGKHHAARRHGHDNYRGFGFRTYHGGYLGRRPAAAHRHYNACHKVSKVGYRHRQKALIGGTACYDRYGNLYVVEGSRYIIRYLVADWR